MENMGISTLAGRARKAHVLRYQRFAVDYYSYPLDASPISPPDWSNLRAKEHNIPSVISFTIETDNRLPSGQPLSSAIDQDDLETEGGPAYFMINCAHPTHFQHHVDTNKPWTRSIHALRANASCRSHSELDEAAELEKGNSEERGKECARLQQIHTNLSFSVAAAKPIIVLSSPSVVQ